MVFLKRTFQLLFFCDRNGHEADYITGLGLVSSKWFDQFLTLHIEDGSLLITDKASSFKAFSKHQEIKHKSILVTKENRVDGTYHIQHVNSYHSCLKNWMIRFHGVATKYLNNYLGWAHQLHKRHITDSQQLIKRLVNLKQPLPGT